MFTLEDVKKEYRRLDKMLNVNTENIEIKTISGFSMGGWCKSRGGKPIAIGINKLAFECSENDFYDVIRHEYAHAVDIILHKNSNHGASWQRICRQIGCNPVSTVDKNSELNQKLEQLRKESNSGYQIVCPHCGYAYTYQRMCATVRCYNEGTPLKCGYCHKKFSKGDK